MCEAALPFRPDLLVPLVADWPIVNLSPFTRFAIRFLLLVFFFPSALLKSLPRTHRFLFCSRNPNPASNADALLPVSREKNRFRGITWGQYDPGHQKHLEISEYRTAPHTRARTAVRLKGFQARTDGLTPHAACVALSPSHVQIVPAGWQCERDGATKHRVAFRLPDRFGNLSPQQPSSTEPQTPPDHHVGGAGLGHAGARLPDAARVAIRREKETHRVRSS